VDAAPAQLLSLAERAAALAGTLLLERFRTGTEQTLRTKSTSSDLVSEADLAAERTIRELLAAERPGDAILGEEGGATAAAGAGGLEWIVDPLDGTVNFLKGIPQWAVSIAVRDAAGTIAGVVLDPNRAELFTALRDGPALRDGIVLSGSPVRALADAVVGTGFAYDAGVRTRQGEIAARVIPRAANLRRAGSAALDLCWAAAGRLDAYYERGVQPWDVAAGELICRRAGLHVMQLPSEDGFPSGLMVAPPSMADELFALVGS
jgi:myo-inositol-1(or 4)-monophosphatase